MKPHTILYWTATALITLQMGFSGVANLLRVDEAMRTIRLLGYPDYFPVMLGVAKILGLIALYMPYMFTVPARRSTSGPTALRRSTVQRLKEWAYAGFAFDIIAAFVSHLAMHNYTPELAATVFGFAALMISYVYHPTLHHEESAPQLA
jgi:hypothetical protein